MSKDFVEHKGVTLDGDSFEAVSPATGRPLRVYDMDEWQVQAELEVRDIPRTGNADDRAFRLQVCHIIASSNYSMNLLSASHRKERSL